MSPEDISRWWEEAWNPVIAWDMPRTEVFAWMVYRAARAEAMEAAMEVLRRRADGASENLVRGEGRAEVLQAIREELYSVAEGIEDLAAKERGGK